MSASKIQLFPRAVFHRPAAPNEGHAVRLLVIRSGFKVLSSLLPAPPSVKILMRGLVRRAISRDAPRDGDN